MFRPILSLWRQFILIGFLAGVVAFSAIGTVSLARFFWPVALICLFPTVWLAYLIIRVFRGQWYAPIVRNASKFRTITNRRVTLHYAAEIDDDFLARVFLVKCAQEVQHLESHFGFRLPGRIAVFLISESEQSRATFLEEGKGGFAVFGANMIVVTDWEYVLESLRHELAHLFAGSRNPYAPRIFAEGLSVWLQQTWGGSAIQPQARSEADFHSELIKLTDNSYFDLHSDQNSCYLVAGSFTGYLIQQFGWASYWRFYQCIGPPNWQARFVQCFGVPFVVAEQQWRGFLSTQKVVWLGIPKHDYPQAQ